MLIFNSDQDKDKTWQAAWLDGRKIFNSFHQIVNNYNPCTGLIFVK